MNRISRAALGLLLLATALSWTTPAHAVDFSCGYVALNTDPTDPQNIGFEGMLFNYFTYDGDDVSTVSDTSVTCALQTAADYGGGGTIADCTFTGPFAFTGYGACQTAVTVAPATAVFICTTFSYTKPSGSTVRNFDFDSVTPGDQCSLLGFQKDAAQGDGWERENDPVDSLLGVLRRGLLGRCVTILGCF